MQTVDMHTATNTALPVASNILARAKALKWVSAHTTAKVDSFSKGEWVWVARLGGDCFLVVAEWGGASVMTLAQATASVMTDRRLNGQYVELNDAGIWNRVCTAAAQNCTTAYHLGLKRAGER
jgi:hypothetical protein